MTNRAPTSEVNGTPCHQNSPTSSKLCEASNALCSEVDNTPVTGNSKTICCYICRSNDWCFLSGLRAENGGCSVQFKDIIDPVPLPSQGTGSCLSCSLLLMRIPFLFCCCSDAADGIGVEASGMSVAGSTGTHHRPASVNIGRGDHLSSHTVPYLAGNDQDLGRPIQRNDICYISECEHLTRNWLDMGWLMLSSIGYTMKQIRNEVMKDYLDASNSAKVIHLTEEWQRLRSGEATARALVDICCHKKVGGVRCAIVNALKDRPGSHGK